MSSDAEYASLLSNLRRLVDHAIATDQHAKGISLVRYGIIMGWFRAEEDWKALWEILLPV